MKDKSIAPMADLIATRRAARDAMRELGTYGGRETRQWDIKLIETHARALLAAVDYFKQTGTK
jgi:hypothetical protein